MEEPDREAAHVDGVEKDGKKNDVLTASHSSEDSDSWTLLGKENDRLKGETSGVQEAIKEEVVEKSPPSRKQRHDSHRSTDSQLDESSDGIVVISESDASSLEVEEDSHDDQGSTVHFYRRIDLKKADYEPLTPPFTPDEVKATKAEGVEKKKELQVKHPVENSVEPVRAVVEHYNHTPVSNAKWVVFSLIATGMVAVILGNSMRLQNRVDEINFEHEKRISELELENNILKNEMNKLRHLYTRSELDEQVQQAEFEWIDALNQENVDESSQEPIQPPLQAENVDTTDGTSQQPMRKVPPQDNGVQRKVVWSGDEEEPMLIVDKDFVLPAFCYNQDEAVHDDLFSEYSAKYCDIKKRKIEAKQKKVEFLQKKQPKQENYNKFINPSTMEPTQEKRADPNKPASPFNIDYQKAFDAIKAEGSVIVEALGSILDLSPEPEDHVEPKAPQVASPTATIPDVPDVSASKSAFVPKEKDVEINRELPEQNRKQQKYDDNKRRKHRSEENEMQRTEDKSRSSEEYKHKQSKDGKRHEDYHKQKNTREKNGKYDGKERKEEHGSHEYNKYVGDIDHRNGPKEKYDDDGKHKQHRGRKHYHHRPGGNSYDDDDDDEDDHYKKKFDQREPMKDHNRNSKPYDQPSGEGSYLEQYKRAERKKPKGHHNDDHYNHDAQKHNHDKQQAYKQHQNQKNGDWNEKRYKGRDEYRQNGGKHGERGSGDQHWQERMKHGRREARTEQRKQMEQENNWYLERGNQREEERIFHHTDGGTR